MQDLYSCFPPDNIESHSSSNGLLLIKEIRYEIGDSISFLFTGPYINAKLQAYGFHEAFPKTMWIISKAKILKSFLSIIILCYTCKFIAIHTAHILAHLVDHYIITKYEMITTYYFPSWRWQIISFPFCPSPKSISTWSSLTVMNGLAPTLLWYCLVIKRIDGHVKNMVE